MTATLAIAALSLLAGSVVANVQGNAQLSDSLNGYAMLCIVAAALTIALGL